MFKKIKKGECHEKNICEKLTVDVEIKIDYAWEFLHQKCCWDWNVFEKRCTYKCLIITFGRKLK